MREKGLTQAEYARRMGISRQQINQYMTGRRSLLTSTGKDLLESLGVRIRLEPIQEVEDAEAHE